MSRPFVPRRAKVDRAAAQTQPHVIWNAFIELLATSRMEVLNEVQRVAFHSFWYDAEVQNGGHIQYFSNRGEEHSEETAVALEQLGAGSQAGILREAAARWRSKQRLPTAELEAYWLTARTGEFLDLDAAYDECEPDVTNLLEEYLREYRAEFIELIDEV